MVQIWQIGKPRIPATPQTAKQVLWRLGGIATFLVWKHEMRRGGITAPISSFFWENCKPYGLAMAEWMDRAQDIELMRGENPGHAILFLTDEFERAAARAAHGRKHD
jgi:hypothetical protein